MSFKRNLHPHARVAIVLSCAGAPDGDINVVRALGREGVPVYVASEYAKPPSSYSKYCRELFLVPGFNKAPEATVAALIALTKRFDHKPILFPTADPDLQLVTGWRSQLEAHFEIPIARSELVAALTDKRRFAELALQYNFPVPATQSLDGVTNLEQFASTLTFPVIVKPADTLKWASQEIEQIVGPLKALVAWTHEEFVAACSPLLQYAENLLVQRYIPGDDQCYYDLQAYFDQNGESKAWFTARKIRTWPPTVGAGCCVESVIVEELAALGLKCLRDIGFTGLVDLDFKRHPSNGEFFLIEINPRTAAWNILPTYSGINFPYIAYSDLTGTASTQTGRQKEARRYLHFRNDLRALQQYRQSGQWAYTTYFLSLLKHKLVFQLLAVDDPRPFFEAIRTLARTRIRKLLPARVARVMENFQRKPRSQAKNT